MIKPRYADGRASELSRCLCDIVLERLSRETGIEPGTGQKMDKVLLYSFGEARYQLRTYAASTSGELWTNIGPGHAQRLIKNNARYLGIAYSKDNPRKVLIYYIDPGLIIEHYERARTPVTASGEWCVRIYPDACHDACHLRFMRQQMDPVQVPEESGAKCVTLDLTDEEASYLRDASIEAESTEPLEEPGEEAGEAEEAAEYTARIDDVTVAFDLLTEELNEAWEEYKQEVINRIRDCQSGLGAFMQERAQDVERLEEYRHRVAELRTEWLDRFIPRKASQAKMEAEKVLEEEPAAFRRTEFSSRADTKMVHFGTKRPGSGEAYVNRVPFEVVIQIGDAVAEAARRQKTFSTSEVLQNVREFIRENSRYGKSSRTPVLCFINVALKEGILAYAEGYTRRYVLATGRSPEDLSTLAHKMTAP